MRRLLSPVRLLVIHTSRRRGGARLSPYQLPRRFFSASLSSARSWGWGAAAVPPQPVFSAFWR